MKQWATDSFAENKLSEYGIEWNIQTIAMQDIDWEGSANNKAREIKPINGELMEDYALAMQSGDIFPMIVVEKTKAGYLILSGNHRSQAARSIGHKTVDAYIVKGDAVAMDILPRLFNRGHGARQNRSEAVINAVWAVNQHGLTARRAAELFGISVSTVQEQLRADAIAKKLEAAGIESCDLNRNAKLRLNTIATDAVMVSAARIIADCGLPDSQSFQLIEDIKSEKRSEAAQMAVVSSWQIKLKTELMKKPEQLPKRGQRNVRTDFLIGIRTVERSIKGIKNLSQLSITDEKEKREIAGRLSEISKRLHKISCI